MIIDFRKSKGATISDDEKYRYCLHRIWNRKLSYVMFIMLNPSTADANKDDATIRKCMAYAKTWGYGGILVGNLYALRSRDPKALEYSSDPVGPDCDRWLKVMAKVCDLRIAAWGNKILSTKRADQIKNLIPPLSCLELSKNGNPKHPLYLRKTLKPRLLVFR